MNDHPTAGFAQPAALFAAEAALVLTLVEQAARPGGLVFVDDTGDRLERLADAARFVAPDLEVLTLPAWDCLPYDRAPPSPAVLGRRVATLCALADEPRKTRLLLTTERSVLQLVPPPGTWRDAAIGLELGQALDADELVQRLARSGYHADEHVDEPGKVALHGHIVDVHPGDRRCPVRIEIAEGRLAALHEVDPETQRSTGELKHLAIRPVAEFPVSDAGAEAATEAIHSPDGDEAPADAPVEPEDGQRLVGLLDYVPSAAIVLRPEAERRWAEWHEQIADAFAAQVRLSSMTPRLPPKRLFLTADAALRIATARQAELTAPAAVEILPPARRLADVVAQIRATRAPVIVAAGDAAAAARIASGLSRRGKIPARVASSWQEARAADGAVACVPLELSAGTMFEDMCLIAAPVAPSGTTGTAFVDEPPRPSDVVVHADHGVCRLAGLSDVDGEERVALSFADDAETLVPVAELDRIWRYGSTEGGIGLDRLGSGAWEKRRDEIAAEVAAAARALAEEAHARAARKAPPLRPAAAAMARFAGRFAFTPSPDQQGAITATLADLASGRPMDRLVCGDVGFGKTEVALRAAAAAVLSGYQVAVVAPTTVLARQHLETFRRRFRGFDVRVEPMLRGAAAAGEVRRGLADGSVGIVVGTHAIAADSVRFARLGLVVIDEEQRFGDAQKAKLAALRNAEGGVHALVMTATPIPRTLEAAMVGLRDVSVIATPPVRRRPTRTFVVPFDPVTVREALLRERRRDGQSFVVCPRIEAIGGMEARLRELVPELELVVAHGRMKPDTLESRIAAFASGEHDVLLATNIIEAGLDIPRANTILIDRPDRFGLAQLHQMRGRVGRGERGGVAYLLTDPATPLAAPTLRRLRTLERQEGLGAGFAISMADMDARGAGDLFGDRQAGHVRAIGTELYQRLLGLEMARLRGESPPPPAPDLRVEVTGRIPAETVPEAALRLELYRRLVRLADAASVDDFEDELVDRFGPVPSALAALLDLARLRVWCMAHGVVRVDAGPQAVAVTTTSQDAAAALAGGLGEGWHAKGERAVLGLAVADPAARLRHLLERLTQDG